MRFPEFLKSDGTIGFVAPSFGCNTEPYKTAFKNAQKKLGELGHKLDIGPNCYAGDGIARHRKTVEKNLRIITVARIMTP